jgi:hypothetical protein
MKVEHSNVTAPPEGESVVVEVEKGAVVWRQNRAWKAGDRLRVSRGDGFHMEKRGMVRRVSGGDG